MQVLNGAAMHEYEFAADAGLSDIACEFALLKHAPLERGIPAFFHSPPASESLFFAWPKKM